jgi:hypothetical protein
MGTYMPTRGPQVAANANTGTESKLDTLGATISACQRQLTATSCRAPTAVALTLRDHHL